MLFAGIETVQENGVDATSLTEVADRAQAPRGSIYHHFPGGKAELLRDAIRLAGTLRSKQLAVLLADDDPTRIVDEIIDMFRQQLQASDYRAGCPVAASVTHGDNYPEAMTAAGESFSSWEELITQGLWQRGLTMEHAQSLATMILTSIEGALLLAKAQQDTQALDRIQTELTKAITTAIHTATPERKG
ncbi:TetR/AcrR family transcriptional regulator [Streptomyces sp. NEAU-YJ-81]|uniref:TetR/AcrR family transcriptional regulator n=1 Tax=Streptomyces sp. NEAU-YJ-81 TaxID=2820288 RepID=UPI001ABC0059|nr:TetR/AcrR family transcriptional regulator [Streptomyces sp. NEAU-YJ-81]MBO3675312.1 TetR/AcrR family transcriptional regulator [Streptomyces sp. NEAU-YJ-81]